MSCCLFPVIYYLIKFYNGIPVYIYIYILVQITPSITLNNVTSLNIFLLDVNFEKSTVELYYLHIFFMLAKLQCDQRSIVMSSINCLN